MKRNDIIHLMYKTFLNAPAEYSGEKTMEAILEVLERIGAANPQKLANYESVLKKIKNTEYSDYLHIEQMAADALAADNVVQVYKMWRP